MHYWFNINIYNKSFKLVHNYKLDKIEYGTFSHGLAIEYLKANFKDFESLKNLIIVDYAYTTVKKLKTLAEFY